MGLGPYQPRQEEDNSLWDALTFLGFWGAQRNNNKVVKDSGTHLLHTSFYNGST